MSWTLGIRALVTVDRGMKLHLTRPWFKSKVDTRNSREEYNITATLVGWSEAKRQLIYRASRQYLCHFQKVPGVK
jgi:hypothetical protein